MQDTEPRADSKGAFSTVARVLRHPRCINCHTLTQFPRVGDNGMRHRMNVLRGPKDKGVSAMQCSTCHSPKNQDLVGIPGAPHWQLAPLSMGWEGLDDHDLAKSLIDRKKNGDRSFEALIKHMGKDPLVLWAWQPGANRKSPPITHAKFIAAFKFWLNDGAQLPQPGVTSY